MLCSRNEESAALRAWAVFAGGFSTNPNARSSISWGSSRKMKKPRFLALFLRGSPNQTEGRSRLKGFPYLSGEVAKELVALPAKQLDDLAHGFTAAGHGSGPVQVCNQR
jgi:hypothetical protein